MVGQDKAKVFCLGAGCKVEGRSQCDEVNVWLDRRKCYDTEVIVQSRYDELKMHISIKKHRYQPGPDVYSIGVSHYHSSS